jgi:hypothetical protein
MICIARTILVSPMLGSRNKSLACMTGDCTDCSEMNCPCKCHCLHEFGEFKPAVLTTRYSQLYLLCRLCGERRLERIDKISGEILLEKLDR